MKHICSIIIAVLSLCMFQACDDGEPTLTTAALIVQDVINEKFAADCDYNNLDVRGSEDYTHYFTVYQKFTSSRLGYQKEFVYKATAEFKGGDKYDPSCWSVYSVLVEDPETGRQWNY